MGHLCDPETVIQIQINGLLRSRVLSLHTLPQSLAIYALKNWQVSAQLHPKGGVLDRKQ